MTHHVNSSQDGKPVAFLREDQDTSTPPSPRWYFIGRIQSSPLSFQIAMIAISIYLPHPSPLLCLPLAPPRWAAFGLALRRLIKHELHDDAWCLSRVQCIVTARFRL